MPTPNISADGPRWRVVLAAPASVLAGPRHVTRSLLPALGRMGLVACAVLPAISTSRTEPAAVAAVSAAAALALVIGVLRWAPSRESDDGSEARPVAMSVLALAVAVSLQLSMLSWGHPGWTTALIGPLATIGVLTCYLATFGFQATFLLRRLGLLSLLLWAPLAAVTDRVVHSSLDPLSELIYRRLASVNLSGVADHPWRVFTAMTDSASLIAITAVVMGTAISRRRLTARVGVELALAITVAMVVHHATILTAPIERYDRPGWVDFVGGPRYELLLGIGAALLAAWMATRAAARDGRAQNPSVTAARDRDPVLFSVGATDEAPMLVRVGAAVVSVLLLAVVVAKAVTS